MATLRCSEFAKHALGVKLWPRQEKILNGLFEDKTNHDFDFVIDDCPYVLEAAHENGSVAIVVSHPFNEHLTEEDGYYRLNYEGEKPKGLAEAIVPLGLDTYQIIQGE